MGAESCGVLKAWKIYIVSRVVRTKAWKIHIVFRVVRTKVWKIHIVFRVVRTKAWKALLSEAVVTEDKVLGKSMLISCLEGSTSLCVRHTSPISKVLSSRQLSTLFVTRDSVPGYDRCA